MLDLVWYVPALPLVAAVLIAFFGRALGGRNSGYIAAAAGVAALVIAAGAFAQLAGSPAHAGAGGAHWPAVRFDWLQIGGKTITIGMLLDPLAAVTLVVVTLVNALVQIYSIGYMAHDVRVPRYFAVLSLFTSGMLALVLADNFLLLLLAWEVMGLCSYLLISHYFEQQYARDAAVKAFMTTRVGDIGLMVGIWVLFAAAGSLSFSDIDAKVSAGQIAAGTLVLAALLIFSGAVGKSAQFPLHIWLPDAMAAPTPVSALLHAATMVAAGVYLVARSYFVFAASPAVLTLVAVIGAITALLAATIATVRTDIKQVLAYSTVSQLGYMMVALGVGSATAAMFHLVTHAFFKALLFLASGSVIHAVHTQEMHQMGGLRQKLPITFWTWIIGMLALAGVPPFAGFFSKDEILVAAYHWAPAGAAWLGPVVFGMAALTAFLTAYYMCRATLLTFFGKPRDHHKFEHAHESPFSMTAPLMILAVPSVLAGFGGGWLGHFMGLAGAGAEHGGTPVPVVATVLAVAGIVLAYALYGTKEATQKRAGLMPALGPVYVTFKNKYWMDELYAATVVAATYAAARAARWFDQVVVDGVVNGVANVSLTLGDQLRRLQTGQVQYYMVALGVVMVLVVVLSQLIGRVAVASLP